MPNRIYNYAAFYVAEPFFQNNLGANAAPDFCYYNMLRAWKGNDPSFPFLDAHATTYDVRDGSSWATLLSRLHERLRNSKNIVLFLSDNTRNSNALREEIQYGINNLGLPIIVVYPDLKNKTEIGNNGSLTQKVRKLWDNLPVFRDNMYKVPTIHVSMDQSLITKSLNDPQLTVQHKTTNGCWFYK